MTPSSSAISTAALCLIAFALTAVNAAVYNVSHDGMPMSLTDALLEAGAGDTISLGDGIYREPIVTMNAGEEGNPLVIEGGRGAVINYFSGEKSLMWSQKVVDIRHSWITLKGFTVNGWLNTLNEEDSFVDKCIWVEGQAEPTMVAYRGKEVKSSLIGTHIEDMKIKNCGMEGIRMRNFVTNSVVKNNKIKNTGIYDFRFQFDSVIGEAIYIGTSSNQWADGAPGRVTNGEDECNYNLVTGNRLEPRGNECVDLKEGTSMNVIEHNECIDQRDPESGCYDSRGNGNVFRYNSGDQCLGAGIRLGGNEPDGVVYGVDNIVYGNDFTNTEYGSIKSMQHPQGVICGNTCSDGECGVKEKGPDEEIEASWDQECPSSFPAVPFIDDVDEEIPAPTIPEVPKPETTPEVPAPTPAAPAPTDMPQGDDAALPGYKMLGCFADTCNARVMKFRRDHRDLTIETCALECKGFAFFGTQYGVECWCGGDETDHVQHGESELCDIPCAGDSLQLCGGFWSMSVYEYTSATATPSTPGTAPPVMPPATPVVPPATPVASPAAPVSDGEDTTTTAAAAGCNGVLSLNGHYCCALSCGSCGGTGCSTRDGGAAACCTSDIKAKRDMCGATDGAAPSLVDEFAG